jgi:cell division protein FtsW (lipid II flippase)
MPSPYHGAQSGDLNLRRLPMSSNTQDSLAPIKRFLAIFLLVWAIVLAYLGFTNAGSSRVMLLIAAVVCLIAGVYLARSFAFFQKKEF